MMKRVAPLRHRVSVPIDSAAFLGKASQLGEEESW